MSAQQTQLLVQTFLLAESKLVPLSPGLSTGPPETEFSVFLEKISAQRSSSSSGDANLSFLSFKHVKQERVFKISNKSSALTQKKEAVSQPDEAQKLQPRESSVMERSADSVKVKDSPAPVSAEDDDVYQTAGPGGAKNTPPDSAGENGVTGKSVQPSDGALSGKGSVSLPDDAVQPSQNAFVDEAQDAAETVATRVEFLLVQFMFLLQGNLPSPDDAQNVSVDAAPRVEAQSNLLFTGLPGVQTDGLAQVPVQGSQAFALELANQLKELESAAQEFLQTMELKRVQGAHLKAGGAGVLTDSELMEKLSALLKELEGVVEEYTLFVPQTVTDAGAEKLKELMQFAEQVKLLVQKVSAEAEEEARLAMERGADIALNAENAAIEEEHVLEALKIQQDAAENMSAPVEAVEETEVYALPQSENGGQIPAQDDAAFTADVSDAGTAENMKTDSVKPFTELRLTEFVDNAIQKAGQVFEKASGGALSSAQKTGALNMLASLAGKSGAGSLFAPIFSMSFKELMNVPKAFAEEIQNILQLKEFSVAGVQVMQDALVTAALSAEKLSLAMSDSGNGAQNGKYASLSNAPQGSETEFKLELSPLAQQLNTVLQNSTVSDTHPMASAARAAEENVLKFSQALVKSGQLLLSAGTADMRIRLRPEHLGDLRLRIMMEEGILSATFTAQSQQVKEILESHLSLLKQSLKDQGIHVEKFVVTTGNPGEYAQAQQNAGSSAMNQQSSKSAVSFAGDGSADEEQSAQTEHAKITRVKRSQVDYFV